MKIDIHTHILPKNLPRWAEKFGYGGFIQIEHHKAGCARMIRDDGKLFREIEENCWSPEKRLQECDEHGISVQVLSTVPVMFSYWAKPEHALQISQFLNDEIAKTVKAYPKRFVGLGTVPLQDTELAIKELERCKNIGLVGVEIGTNVNQENLGEQKFFEFFLACQELEMAVFVHPWEMMGQEHIQKYWLAWLVGMPAETARAICSLIFSGTLERLPRLRICFAHGGGSFPATIGRIEHGFLTRPDLCAIDNHRNPREYLRKIYYDSLVHSAEMLDYLVNLVGAERVALGTDYPFPLGERYASGLIENMPYPQEVKAQLLYKTALEWLNLKEEKFSSFRNESRQVLRNND
ncbi:MAG: amidohydrolase family protein [Acidobacteriota bacterium]|nr:amidohydrolase family protein [Acidobacteriota bacterium]